MADASGRLTFVLDENSSGLRQVLQAARADAHDRLATLPEVGIAPGTLDTALLHELGQRGRFALILRDARVLDPVLQRQAWRDSGVTLFILGKDWGKLPLRELARRALFLWPRLVAHAEAGGQGVAWRVAPAVPSPGSNAFRLVTGRHADPAAG